MIGPSTFRFLNEVGSLGACDWESAGSSKLWLYNLHYFDDLNAANADERSAWHDALISRWIADNPPGRGTGWDPYPTSLRIVNWVKRARTGQPLSDAALHSLAIQTRWLMRRLEFHLLGNHLLANAKALVFAGCFFTGAEAEGWLFRGLTILEREIPEQILADGGHFELSTMYHVLAVEDMLDLVNILRSTARPVPDEWVSRIKAMRKWLSAMTHPDGEIAFFNDAAIGVAPSPAEIEAYAARLDLPPVSRGGDAGLTWLSDSGYIRVEQGTATALLDVARVGPDYNPGHAHADTLSFELSLGRRRILTNTGVSTYQAGSVRQRQRGTAAHNTVVMDGINSSEVWSSFRVGRRAKPVALSVESVGEERIITCAHDGYDWLPGQPRHYRTWILRPSELEVVDEIKGGGDHVAEARFHFHPSLHPDSLEPAGGAAETGVVRLATGHLSWTVLAGTAKVEPAFQSQQFGSESSTLALVVQLQQGLSHVKFEWQGCPEDEHRDLQ